MCVSGLPELIAFAMNNKNHADRHKGWRDDKNQNSTAQGLNHSSPGGGRLRIAERTTLRKGRERSGEHDQRNQRSTDKEERSLDPHLCS